LTKRIDAESNKNSGVNTYENFKKKHMQVPNSKTENLRLQTENYSSEDSYENIHEVDKQQFNKKMSTYDNRPLQIKAPSG